MISNGHHPSGRESSPVFMPDIGLNGVVCDDDDDDDDNKNIEKC